jgi:PAS domain S-box-containing protein
MLFLNVVSDLPHGLSFGPVAPPTGCTHAEEATVMLPEATTGISVMCDMPWGTHFCYFFETKEDLLDASVSFFQAGLENREFCLWNVYAPITEADALWALRQSIPGLDRYLAERGMEICVHTEPLFDGAVPEARASARYLDEKLDDALARGYSGMRVALSPANLQKENKGYFREFERELGRSVANHRMIALCHFPLAESSVAEILDAAQAHQFVIARRQGNWEMAESPEIKAADAEITKLNELLEQRVEERTRALEAANEELRQEIAQRKRAEQELRKQKEILQTIFDHIPLMINFGDSNHSLQLVNREWEQTLGWSLEEIRRDNVDILVENYPDPQYRAQVRDFLNNSNGEWADFKTTVRDGRVIDTSWVRLYLSDGSTMGIGQDITKRKRAEEALKESEERFRQLAENIHDLFWIKTADFKRVLYLSPVYESLSGWSRQQCYEEVDYQAFLAKIHPEDRERVAQILRSGAGAEFDIEFRYVRPDGSLCWLRDRGFPIRDASGQVYRCAGIATDITKFKLAEEALRESEERFRQLTENIHEVFWLRSPDFKHLLYVSPMYEKVCGRACESFSGEGTNLAGIHPEDRARVIETVKNFAGHEFEIEYRIITKDCEVRWLRDRGFPIRDQSGKIYRIGGVAEDITDRKVAEERLKASSEQLRALSASLQSAREKEATRIAHQIHDEMGGILTGLRWELEAFEKMIQQPADPGRSKLMRDKLATMLGLTDTTINVVRRIASELRPSILDDLGLVEAIEWQTQQFQARTGIQCRCQCSLQTIPLGDQQSTAVFRIVQEALTNILRHAQATRVGVAMKEEDGIFTLTVTDNGRGITPGERLSRNSLGLLGMQERAHLVGGQVDIVGFQGTGTTLHVRVPLGAG